MHFSGSTEPEQTQTVSQSVRDQFLEPFITAVDLTLREWASTEVVVQSIFRTKQHQVLGEVASRLDLRFRNPARLVLAFPEQTATAPGANGSSTEPRLLVTWEWRAIALEKRPTSSPAMPRQFWPIHRMRLPSRPPRSSRRAKRSSWTPTATAWPSYSAVTWVNFCCSFS